MLKLFQQIIKFSFVGAICFIIDYLIGIAILNILMVLLPKMSLEFASVVGATVGFIVSVIANYILSFKFVFERREEIDRRTEFGIFILLSIVGLLINALIMWITVGLIYRNSGFLRENFGYNMIYSIAKIVATAIVMIYNFVTRKIFLEKK